MQLRHLFFQTLIICHRTLQKWTGASSVGVRILVINSKNEILLVEHTYVDGWHFPGGGVNRNESMHAAAKRELWEESGVIATKTLSIFNIYHHDIHGVTDYPILFVTSDFQNDPNAVLSPEIKQAKWFSLNALPSTITQSTQNRINEYFYQAPVSELW